MPLSKRNLFLIIILLLGSSFWAVSIRGNSPGKKRESLVVAPNEKNNSTQPQATSSAFGKIISLNKQAPILSNTKVSASKPSGFCLNAPVLLYHHVGPLDQARKEGNANLTVDPGIFDQQMKYLLDRGYRTFSAEDLANALLSHQVLAGKPVVVTLDDGYADAFSYAFPIAKKYNIILNLMIPTGLIGNQGYLSWEKLKEMIGSGLIFAYDHTWSHYALTRGSDEKVQFEVMTSKTQLEQQLGRQVKIIAYPYGSYDQKVISMVRNDGFIAGYTTISSSYQCDSLIFEIRRTRIGNSPLSSYGL